MSSFPDINMMLNKKNIKGLIKALKHQHPQIRSGAAKALGTIADVRAVESLSRSLTDENSDVRRESARSLGKISGAKAIEILKQALQVSNKIIRREILESVASLGDSRLMDVFLIGMNDEDEVVRLRAIEALSIITGSKLIEPFIQALHDSSATNRISAAVRLGNIGDIRAAEPLFQAFQSERDREVRNRIIQSLGKLRDARVVEPLIKTFRDQKLSFKCETAEILGKIGDLRAADIIINSIFTIAEYLDISEFNSWIENFKNLFGDYTTLILRASNILIRTSKVLTMFKEGEEYSYDIIESNRAVEALCRIRTQISSNILHKVLQKKDEEVIIRWFCEFSDRGELKFEYQREIARKELNLRGNPPYNPSVYLIREQWKL